MIFMPDKDKSKTMTRILVGLGVILIFMIFFGTLLYLDLFDITFSLG